MTELEVAIHDILLNSDLASVSIKSVRKQLAASTDSRVTAALEALDKDAVKALIKDVYDRLVPPTDAGAAEDEDEGEVKHEDADEVVEEASVAAAAAAVAATAADERVARALQAADRGRARRATTASASASAAAKAPRKKPDAHTPKKRAAGASAGTGFSKPMVLSEPLELLMRAVKVPDDQESPTPPNLPNPDPNEPLLLSRPEVVKRLWIHIKARDLQDPSNKTTILCDPLMEAIFKVKKLGMFKMNKYLSQHLKSANDVFGVGNDQLERHAANTLSKSPGIRGNRARKSSDFVVDSDEDENADENENEDDDDDEDEEDVEDDADDDRHLDVDPSLSSKTKKKSKAVSKKRKPDQEDASNDYGSDLSDDPPRKKGKSVFSRPYNLSPELQAVVGSAEPIARHEAVKQIWAYIKTNDLQDPSDRRFILCDDNLLALFKQPRISGFSMNKFLGDHLYKI